MDNAATHPDQAILDAFGILSEERAFLAANRNLSMTAARPHEERAELHMEAIEGAEAKTAAGVACRLKLLLSLGTVEVENLIFGGRFDELYAQRGELLDGNGQQLAQAIHELKALPQPADPFAAAWLAQWTAYGGSVTRDHAEPEKVWIGHPEYHFSPVAAEDEARMTAGGLPEDQRGDQRAWHRWFYSGKMRALNDLLDAVPGGLEAVKAIVRADPAKGLSSQTAEAAGEEVGS